ncbi:ATP-dependent RNA helicase HAS1 [Elsinoe australis]|uniref:ATP-dependent RNA helicase n=1 Tax=Elsinoe australis TaxID=40998 RepID=A0A2P8AG48_9PEZI|nr:ATP-dependent RNA helicase HAS1 [Elsinoe australis]
MAEDGMLLNLAPDIKWEARPVFKGGRWKDRLTAKKSAEYGAQKRKEREALANGGEVPIAAQRPKIASGANTEDRLYKRQRTDVGDRPRTSTQLFRPGTERKIHDGQTRGPIHSGSQAPKEFISSLFTYNPESTATKPETAEAEDDAEAVEASNAPLSPEMENFVNLGLSRSLAAHLLNKMSIKAPTSIQRKAVSQLLKEDSDAFVQAETGSGKTLAYLLPLVQRLLELSQKLKDSTGQKMNRHSGMFAVILAPTRELSKQISTVLEALLGCANWIVPGTVIGGEKKKSEKARLRKGVNILVATPGRLADHLNNTEVLDVSKVRWLVLDEGDRLMELGFEQDIQKIVSTFNLRMRAAQQNEVAQLLPSKRTTVLCSATMKMDVQRLGEISLKDAAHIAADRRDDKSAETNGEDTAFQAPSQLKQSYAVVPAKQRLVTLVAVLRRAFARKGTTMKVIVFVSCADSVDFHFSLLTRPDSTSSGPSASTPAEAPTPPPPSTSANSTQLNSKDKIPQGTLLLQSQTSAPSPSLSTSTNPVQLYRLHGSLPQTLRTSTLSAFSKSPDPSVLLCTDVASRGLDLPHIDLVLEYDPPFSRDEHLHRVGRTARAGRDGRAMIFLLPGCEEGYASVLRNSRREGLKVTSHAAEELMKKGFGPTSGVLDAKRHGEWEVNATEWQLDAERWVLEESGRMEMARRAFQSHVRAYATHVAAERGMFDMKQLHLGHLAKAFALRERPGGMKVPGLRKGAGEVKKERRKAGDGGAGDKGEVEEASQEQMDREEARRKMRMKMKAMGGASEFNLG